MLKRKLMIRNSIGKCLLCGDWDETVNHIISECSKLAKKSTWLETTGWERRPTGNCARNWNLSSKWFWHKPECILENEMQKKNSLEFWDTNRSPNPDLVTGKKKKENLRNSELCRPDESESENQRKQKEWQVFRSCQKSKITWGWRWYQM